MVQQLDTITPEDKKRFFQTNAETVFKLR